MTKKLTPTEKFNRRVERIIESTRNCSCNCISCIFNNNGSQKMKNVKTYGHHCGAPAIRAVYNAYKNNFKEMK